jgi:hypothetical protein
VPAGAEVRSLYAREGEGGRVYLVILAVAK